MGVKAHRYPLSSQRLRVMICDLEVYFYKAIACRSLPHGIWPLSLDLA